MRALISPLSEIYWSKCPSVARIQNIEMNNLVTEHQMSDPQFRSHLEMRLYNDDLGSG